MERDIKVRFISRKRRKLLDAEVDPYSLGSVFVPQEGEEVIFNVEGKEYDEILVIQEKGGIAPSDN